MSLPEKLGIDSFGLRQKLTIAFVIVALLVGVTGFIGYQGVSSVDGDLHAILEDDVPEADASMEMKYHLESERLALHEVLTGEMDASEEFESSVSNFQEWHTKLQERDHIAEQEQLLSEMKTEHEKAVTLGGELIEAKRAGNDELATQKMNQMDQSYQELQEDALTFEEAADEAMETSAAAADSTTSSSQWQIIALTVGAFIAAIAIGLFMARRITSPVEQLQDASVAMSEGDLDSEIEDHTADDELGEMVDAFKDMQGNLRNVFADLDSVSQGLQTGDLGTELRTDYPGTYGEVMQNLDDGTDELGGSFDEIRGVSDDLKRGDLDQTIDTDRPGEYGAVLTALDDGTDQLSESFAEISSASERLSAQDLDQSLD
ncbi:MAG: methyl-accepting chemotaxis protein, partial [Haloarculaceae archaeon]